MVLIVGSFAGAESMKKREYYANKRNRFWRIMGEVLNEKFSTMKYDEKIEMLQALNIGLWDVIASCERKGSLDSSIRNPLANDFSYMPNSLHRIICNGTKTWKYSEKCKAPTDVDIVCAPSTSPANTKFLFDDIVNTWKLLIN